MVYNCWSKILHTLYANNGDNPISYTVSVNGQVVFDGLVTPFTSVLDAEIQIDLAPIFRTYLTSYYENIPLSNTTFAPVPVVNNQGTCWTFTVSSAGNIPSTDPNDSVDVPYTVIYNYNMDYVTTNPDIGNCNNPISNEVDPRQYLSIVGYAAVGSTNYSYAKNGVSGTLNNSVGTQYNLYQVRLNNTAINAQEGDTITMRQGTGGSVASFDYKVVKPCKNRFVIYYVNKLGGLDSLLCSGRYVISWNTDKTDVRLYDDINDRRDFQQTRVHQYISKRYELNTGWIDDDKAELIIEVITAPKLWVHDLDKDTVTSCLCVDSNYSAEHFSLNDIPAQYTFNMEESQRYIQQ